MREAGPLIEALTDDYPPAATLLQSLIVADAQPARLGTPRHRRRARTRSEPVSRGARGMADQPIRSASRTSSAAPDGPVSPCLPGAQSERSAAIRASWASSTVRWLYVLVIMASDSWPGIFATRSGFTAPRQHVGGGAVSEGGRMDPLRGPRLVPQLPNGLPHAALVELER